MRRMHFQKGVFNEDMALTTLEAIRQEGDKSNIRAR